MHFNASRCYFGAAVIHLSGPTSQTHDPGRSQMHVVIFLLYCSQQVKRLRAEGRREANASIIFSCSVSSSISSPHFGESMLFIHSWHIAGEVGRPNRSAKATNWLTLPHGTPTAFSKHSARAPMTKKHSDKAVASSSLVTSPLNCKYILLLQSSSLSLGEPNKTLPFEPFARTRNLGTFFPLAFVLSNGSIFATRCRFLFPRPMDPRWNWGPPST